MPVHLPPLGRRPFLVRLLFSLLSLCGLRSRAAAPAEGECWALLSDLHIDADSAAMDWEASMSAHLRRAVQQVAALDPAPRRVLINGDCAHTFGLPGDYRQLLALLEPLRRRGLAVDCTLGNHDARPAFRAALPSAAAAPLPDRHLTIIESPLANWFLLDSLKTTNETPGRLGPEQQAWLAQELDRRPEKPALLFVHHHPVPEESAEVTGLEDTAELLATLRPRRQVKAVFFGHTHRWSVQEQDGLHFVNLPSVAYRFRPGEFVGWVEARLQPAGLRLRLHAVEEGETRHGTTTDLRWRT